MSLTAFVALLISSKVEGMEQEGMLNSHFLLILSSCASGAPGSRFSPEGRESFPPDTLRVLVGLGCLQIRSPYTWKRPGRRLIQSC